MSTEPEPSAQQAQTSSNTNNDSSSLQFTSSASSEQALPPNVARSPSKTNFQWPSEPLNQGRHSLPQESQKSLENANRDISDRIAQAHHGASSQHSPSDSMSGLDHPRLSVQLANALNTIEDDRRHGFSPTNTSFFPPPPPPPPTTTTTQLSSLPMPIPSAQPHGMQRTESNGTSKSAGSDKGDTLVAGSHQFPAFLPDMFRNAATMPINLLRSLIPDNAFPASYDEGLSASTLQVPVTSFNALFEACKALEWLAAQAANFENQDKASVSASASASRRNSTAQQQQNDDGVDFAYFDYLQLLQKVADVVSGLAASRGIDLVLDLEPKLQGQPADNQRNYKLGSCTVWADRIAMTFLFISCLSRLLHNAPIASGVVLTSTLTEKEENVVRPDRNAEMKLMVLSLGLRLILPRAVASTPELMSAISGTPASILLDAFGARLTTEHSTSKLPGSPDRAIIDHYISVPVGQLPDPEQATAPSQQQQQQQQQQIVAKSKHAVGPNEDELVEFAASLRGKKVALYSTSQSLFARQVARFLGGLGCDIAPVFSDSMDEDSLEGDDVVFGKQAHTAVALTKGRPALVSYTSDIDRQVHAGQSAKDGKREQLSESASTEEGVDPIDTAVLDPVTGVPVTFDNFLLQTGASATGPTPAPVDGTRDASSTQTQINATGRRVVPFSFVIIDDDIATLQKELLRIRSAVPLLKSALLSKSAAANKEEKPARLTLDHRTKSSPQVNRLKGSQQDAHSRSFGSLGTVLMSGDKGVDLEGQGAREGKVEKMDECVSQTIIFFTSMKSYRLVRDTVQPIIDSASFHGVSSPPEIMVLPKPAGAKRILTALHLAEHKPVVQLPYLPIATSPLSPLITQAKSWWTPATAQKQQGEGEGIMTLTRRMTAETDTDFDATPGTPWTPIDAAKTPADSSSANQIPLTSETLPLAAEVPGQGPSVRTNHTQDAARDAIPGAAPPGSNSTTKSAPRSTASRPPMGKAASGGGAGAEDISTQKFTHVGSGSNSATSPLSSIPQRSHAVSSPMPADALEYFNETAAKIGSSAASGMVIQSPDGRPAGIFFQPKATPCFASGSKPTLSRGLSASSLRRSHGSEEKSSVGSDAGARGERRLANRSTTSSNGAGNGPLATVVEQNTAADGKGEGPAQQLQVPNAGKYPSGSMFAPQVGIRSVLNGSRPPMTTPLGPSQVASQQDSERRSQVASGKGEVGSGADASGKQAEQQSTAAKSATDGATAASERASAPAKTTSEATNPTTTTTSSAAPRKPSAPAPGTKPSGTTNTPNARTAQNSANRTSNRARTTTSASEFKTKPSAVAQSGFMMGMGFASSARRGRGPKKAPIREAVLPPIKVLIVEDNPINQRILSMFMGKKKIKYDVANNGRDAVEKWKTGGYHLILMDIQLPVMDGIQATKEIRRLERCANIGILPNSPAAVGEVKADLEVQDKSATQGRGKGSEEGNKVLSGGSRTLTAKGLVKQAIATNTSATEALKKQASEEPSTPPSGALVNDANDSNTIPTHRNPGDGSARGINAFRASVIIVALTASVLSSDRVEALAAGCNDFLNKPVSLPWLNQKILEWGSMMYLMYSGIASDDLPPGTNTYGAGRAGAGAGGSEGDKAQLHLGFGYGPAEKAKALANNLHLRDTLAQKKKKKQEILSESEQEETRLASERHNHPQRQDGSASEKEQKEKAQEGKAERGESK
ncbi:related to SSK1 - two-component signal transducer [Ustilago sp. UG-2017a]|nr:related to SSK1 - two-component signal transducer [Ustilago sp. UG-2017a]